jgi:hypothetical protein
MMTEARSHESATDFRCEVAGHFSMVNRAKNSDVSCCVTSRPYSSCTICVSLHTSLRFSVAAARGHSGKPGTERPPFEASS